MKYKLKTSNYCKSADLSAYKKWLSCPISRPEATMRLFCFPYGGGGASIYRQWNKYLPNHIELIALQPPGRENRLLEPAINSLSNLVNNILSALVDWLDKPFVFFGHSFGAKTAFETTRELRRRNLPEPKHLFVAGQAAPHLPLARHCFHTLSDARFLQAVKKQYKIIPQAVLENEELLSLVMPALRGDFCMSEQYVYQKDNPLNCPITAFGGDKDPEVTQDRLEAWKHETAVQFSSQLFSGDHFFVQTEPQRVINALLQTLNHFDKKNLLTKLLVEKREDDRR
ncbi:MAG: thioesterase [Candidatus Electrothrix sp. AW5]|nr:thioesterase [Candidatus Electrothrix gigas]MCI5196840.1 thioesterase [Candidatus Electrothrix gigas]